MRRSPRSRRRARISNPRLQAANYDPAELERIEERLFSLRAAGRKYNAPVDGLAALAQKYAADLALIDAGAEQLAQLEKTAARGRCALSQGRAEAVRRAQQGGRRARQGGQCRDRAAQARTRDIHHRKCRRDSAAGGPNGIDRVEFWAQTNPGTRPGPLMKVASGGELARFLLALKVVLADRGSAPTLIFDEIDTGVGGAVADAIGVRLARLAGRVQAIAVTHAPQVAARADRHYVIAKDALDKGKRVATRVSEVAADRRREEIARMLAGAEITAGGPRRGGTADQNGGCELDWHSCRARQFSAWMAGMTAMTRTACPRNSPISSTRKPDRRAGRGASSRGSPS